MTDFQRTDKGRSDGADPALTNLLRTAYTAPPGDTYWAGLEQRVMARIKESAPLAWWTVFSEWRTAGLIAATFALLLAGAAMVRDRAGDHAPQTAIGDSYGPAYEPAYEAAVEALLAGDAVTFSAGSRRRLPEDAPERYLNPLGW